MQGFLKPLKHPYLPQSISKQTKPITPFSGLIKAKFFTSFRANTPRTYCNSKENFLIKGCFALFAFQSYIRSFYVRNQSKNL